MGRKPCNSPEPLAGDDSDAGSHAITIHLDEMLALRGMTLTELARRLNIALPNLFILKTGKARAVRFSTLTSICSVLDCQPGDVLRYTPPGSGQS